MDYKKYLLDQTLINQDKIAQRMWPTNKSAPAYLSTKLNDKGRPWTAKDNEKAGEVLHEIGQELISLKDRQD